MLKNVSPQTIETLRFVRDAGSTDAESFAKHKAKGNGGVVQESATKAYMRKLVVAGVLESDNVHDVVPIFTISLDGRFTIWMNEMGYIRADGKWLGANKQKLNEVEVLDLREAFANA